MITISCQVCNQPKGGWAGWLSHAVAKSTAGHLRSSHLISDHLTSSHLNGVKNNNFFYERQNEQYGQNVCCSFAFFASFRGQSYSGLSAEVCRIVPLCTGKFKNFLCTRGRAKYIKRLARLKLLANITSTQQVLGLLNIRQFYGTHI